MRTLAIAFTALLLVPAAASAKTGIMLDSTPDGLAAGEPWNASFVYIRDDAPVDPPAGKHASIRITNERTGATRSFTAYRDHRGTWRARVVFREPGRWSYRVEGFGPRAKHQSWEPVTIAPASEAQVAGAPPEVKVAGVDGGGSFPYGWVGAAAGVALLAAAGLLVRRLRN